MPEEIDPPPYRAQLLATEHWGLLASRSTTQSEVLTRINMFLTLVSAGLVSLALVGQATHFSEMFGLFAVVVLAFICLVGVLTQVRVNNAGMDDLMYVLAMNRLRAAYVAMDPGTAPYFLASTHDDQAGAQHTYYFLGKRTSVSQLAGSSMIFMVVVNTALIGLLVAAIAGAAAAGVAVAITLGVVAAAVYFAASMAVGGGNFRRTWTTYSPLSPTPLVPEGTARGAAADPEPRTAT